MASKGQTPYVFSSQFPPYISTSTFCNLTPNYINSLSLNLVLSVTTRLKMKPPSFDTFLSPSKLSMYKDSHTITKPKLKIRIIHIVEPEIIKTDVENFQELVQKLTGKPAAEVEVTTKKEKHEVKGSIQKESNVQSKSLSASSKPKKNMESAGIMKESEKEINEDYPNGFLRFLADVDDFFNYEDDNEFSIPAFKSSQFEEIQLC